MNNPTISVIMSVYNGEKYLHEAISSILNQTYKDFEYIIVDDGSTDGTKHILSFFSDSRIKIFEKNHEGLVSALNFAMQQSSGEYIARMDADDISKPDRLEKQLQFMRINNLALCGSRVETIDQANNKTGNYHFPPIGLNNARVYAFFHNPFIHPSVMFRKDIVLRAGGYRHFVHIEDYELWTRIIYKYPSDNIKEYLLQYRIHGGQITRKSNFTMRFNGIAVRFLAVWRCIFRF